MVWKKIINELKNIKKALREKEHFIKKQKKLTKKATLKTNRAIKELKNETKRHVVTAIVAAFGFIIALVWRDTIKEYVGIFMVKLSISGPSALISFYTALITTLVAVIGIIIITRWASRPGK